ncbi:MAG: hypothetical protein ACR2NX_10620 [Chthoniobacterales bacterium]
MRRREFSEHFSNRFLSHPPEQIGGVKRDDRQLPPGIHHARHRAGVLSGPQHLRLRRHRSQQDHLRRNAQKFQLERRYVNTFLKMLFYTHALRRFDKPAEERRHDNLLILWADEAQRFVSASEDGMSDYNCIDVIREHKRPSSPLHSPRPHSSRRSAGRKPVSSR